MAELMMSMQLSQRLFDLACSWPNSRDRRGRIEDSLTQPYHGQIGEVSPIDSKRPLKPNQKSSWLNLRLSDLALSQPNQRGPRGLVEDVTAIKSKTFQLSFIMAESKTLRLGTVMAESGRSS